MISKSFILLAIQTALATAAAVQGNAGLDKRYLAVEPAAESTNVFLMNQWKPKIHEKADGVDHWHHAGPSGHHHPPGPSQHNHHPGSPTDDGSYAIPSATHGPSGGLVPLLPHHPAELSSGRGHPSDGASLSKGRPHPTPLSSGRSHHSSKHHGPSKHHGSSKYYHPTSTAALNPSRGPSDGSNGGKPKPTGNGDNTTPGDNTPGSGTPGNNNPGENTPGSNTPGDNTPADNTPGSNTPGNNAPGTDANEPPKHVGASASARARLAAKPHASLYALYGQAAADVCGFEAQMSGAEITACPLENSSGWDCLNLASTLESCGGCQSIGEGQDCTVIKGAETVGCIRGKCVIGTCEEGYYLDSSNGTCVAN